MPRDHSEKPMRQTGHKHSTSMFSRASTRVLSYVRIFWPSLFSKRSMQHETVLLRVATNTRRALTASGFPFSLSGSNQTHGSPDLAPIAIVVRHFSARLVSGGASSTKLLVKLVRVVAGSCDYGRTCTAPPPHQSTSTDANRWQLPPGQQARPLERRRQAACSTCRIGWERDNARVAQLG